MQLNGDKIFSFVPSRLIRCITSGLASREGTSTFISKTQIPFYHRIHKPGLIINPTIVDISRTQTGPSNKLQYEQYEQCIRVNRANCLVIYAHNGVDREWYFQDVEKLLNNCKLKRHHLVLMAKIGVSVYPWQDINRQIERILQLCSLTNLDIPIIECDGLSFALKGGPENLNDSFQRLEGLAELGDIHCYGLSMNVSPYCYHTPAAAGSGKLAGYPCMFEESINRELKYLDVMMYPISPTTTTPSTYTMIADENPHDPGNLVSRMIHQKKKKYFMDMLRLILEQEKLRVKEISRTFTRIACNPLTCYPGGGTDSRLSESSTKLLTSKINYQDANQLDTSDMSNQMSNVSDAGFEGSSLEARYVEEQPVTSFQASSDSKSADLSSSEPRDVLQDIIDDIQQLVSDITHGDVSAERLQQRVRHIRLKIDAIKQDLAAAAVLSDEEMETIKLNMTKEQNESNGANSISGNAKDSQVGTTSINNAHFFHDDSTQDQEEESFKDPAAVLNHLEIVLNQLEADSKQINQIKTSSDIDDSIQREGLNEDIKRDSKRRNGHGVKGDYSKTVPSKSSSYSGSCGSSSDNRSQSISETDKVEYSQQSSTAAITSLPPRSDGITLISGRLAPTLERALTNQFNELCPELATTPLLQDKALRCVFSVGIDAVSIDSDIFVHMDRLQLSPHDLITAADTDAVFGNFKLP